MICCGIFSLVSQPGDGAAPLVLSNIKAPKNGYVYIYLSNENDDAVFWDNFTVSYTRGKIIEENHYYAFGLRIAGISSKKFDGGIEGSLKNEFLYNDKELWDDADLDWYDYGFRNYDPRIARFTQLDPLTWEYPELTNYQYASDEPIANVDMDGLEKISTVGGWWNGAYLSKAGNAGASVGNIVAHSIVRSANVAINQINRTSEDNTYLKIPVQNLQLNTNDFPLNQQQATVGPAKRVI